MNIGWSVQGKERDVAKRKPNVVVFRAICFAPFRHLFSPVFHLLFICFPTVISARFRARMVKEMQVEGKRENRANRLLET
jgi:hypothetical protein